MTKNQLQRHIREYTVRREKFRLIYGSKGEAYREKIKPYRAKLQAWRAMLNRIQLREDKIKHLDVMIMDFMGTPSLRNSGRGTKDKNLLLARKIFYKYGMENGIKGSHLEKYIGVRGSWSAGRARMQFTRSFPFNNENKDTWYRFKQSLIKKAA